MEFQFSTDFSVQIRDPEVLKTNFSLINAIDEIPTDKNVAQEQSIISKIVRGETD